MTNCAKLPILRMVLNESIALFENHPAQANEFDVFIPIPGIHRLFQMPLDGPKCYTGVRSISPGDLPP